MFALGTFLNPCKAMFNGQLLFNRVMHVKLVSLSKDFFYLVGCSLCVYKK